MARFRDFQRMSEVNRTTLIGASGEMSDFQYIQDLLEHLVYARARTHLRASPSSAC